MTKLLNSAFEEISKLPEIESEKKWEKKFSNSEDMQDKLVIEKKLKIINPF